jgi:hypothetical protein
MLFFLGKRSWQILNNSMTLPFAMTTDTEQVSLSLDEKDYPHISLKSTSGFNSRLRYAFWDGENWNGMDWSQLLDGIHESSGNFIAGIENPVLKLDSNYQPCIGYLVDHMTNYDESIDYIFNDLTVNHPDLSLGIITNTPEYNYEDKLILSIGIVNPVKIRNVDIYLVLQNTSTDLFWFYPNWTDVIQPIRLTLQKDLSVPLTNILTLRIPNENPPLSYDIQGILGDLKVANLFFGYQECKMRLEMWAECNGHRDCKNSTETIYLVRNDTYPDNCSRCPY